ncbi:MAG: GntR family transcriptional regulator [Burkholderiales bacterium]
MITAVKPSARIVDTVYAALRNAIFSRTVVPGESLSVPELARRLDVSRSPVREAVLQLVADGLAVETPRKGVVVATLDQQDLLDIHEIRQNLETLTATLAASRINAAALKQLRKILERQHTAIDTGDAALYEHTNAEFHSAIAAACGNPRLAQFVESLQDQMRLALLRTVATHPQHIAQGYAEHVAILDALETHAPMAAAEAMRIHISNTRGDVADHLARLPLHSPLAAKAH